MSENSSSVDCIALAKHWLVDCLESHTVCKQSLSPPLPSRVIDVGNKPGDPVKLLVTQGDERGQYVALSHSWGGDVPLRATINTIQSLTQSITFSDSSKTFQDAVDVTQLLGIRYLWLDSLCIIQDSHNDWAEESSKMADVYNNATLTIAATSARNTSEGLFPSKSSRRSRNSVRVISSMGPDGRTQYIYIRARHGDPYAITTKHSQLPSSLNHLSTRGWVLQEELLSPRTLRFDVEEMSWVCSTYTRCECRLRPDSVSIPTLFRAPILSPDTLVQDQLIQTVCAEWPRIVMEMTRRNLTRTSDRIYALAGLATWIFNATGDSYCCGLWADNLSYQLMWYSDISRAACPAPQRIAQPYAPSWAWTSISGPISFFNPSYAMLPAKLSEYSGPDPQGASVIPLYDRNIPVWGLPVTSNRYGPTHLSLLQPTARALPVTFWKNTNTWIPEYPVTDFDSENMKFYIDAPAEGPAYTKGDPDKPRKYWFILVGKWKDIGGWTPAQLQAVCILTREMTSPEDKMLVKQAYLSFCLGIIRRGENDFKLSIKDARDRADEAVNLHLARVGLVQGAGSIEAWEDAVPKTKLNLF